MPETTNVERRDPSRFSEPRICEEHADQNQLGCNGEPPWEHHPGPWELPETAQERESGCKQYRAGCYTVNEIFPTKLNTGAETDVSVLKAAQLRALRAAFSSKANSDRTREPEKTNPLSVNG